MPQGVADDVAPAPAVTENPTTQLPFMDTITLIRLRYFPVSMSLCVIFTSRKG